VKLAEKILILITIIALLFKLFFVPTGETLLSLSTYLLVFFYGIFGVLYFNNISLKTISFKSISSGKIIGAIGLGIVHLFVIGGVVLKIKSLPGNVPSLYIGLLLNIIIFVISYIKYKKNRLKFYKNVIIRTSVLSLLGLILILIPYTVVIEFTMRNHPEYVKAFKEYNKDKSNKTAAENLEREYYRATMDKDEFEDYIKKK
jgi:hypothetical protein|tara:strand:- start:54650 stop:55255 length:606 start_codon:yes stop_codon:yes gene_type:complete